MDRFAVVDLTSARRPVLGQDEIEHVIQRRVGLYFKEERMRACDDGILYLTSERVIWTGDGTNADAPSLAINLCDVAAIDLAPGFLASHPKITLRLYELQAAAQTATMIAVIRVSVTWWCAICQHKNAHPDGDALKCTECGVTSDLGGLKWACPNCTFFNLSKRVCTMCEFTPGKAAGASNNSPAAERKSSSDYIKLSFRGGGHATFFEKLQDALRQRAWERRPPVSPASSNPLPRKAHAVGGISSIMKAAEDSHGRMQQSLNEAFRDVDALMAKAAEMVTMAEAISQKLAKDNIAEDSKEAAEFQSLLLSLGISSPVTKESAGDLYHQELAKQLADFLESILPRYQDILPLTDIYCIYNRARGTELISPDDLYAACVHFERLKLPLKLKRFDSGLMAVHTHRFSDDEVAERIGTHVRQHAFVNAVDVSKLERLSIPMATEALLIAEKKGVVCRDDAPLEGLRFYPNLFLRS